MDMNESYEEFVFDGWRDNDVDYDMGMQLVLLPTTRH